MPTDAVVGLHRVPAEGATYSYFKLSALVTLISIQVHTPPGCKFRQVQDQFADLSEKRGFRSIDQLVIPLFQHGQTR
jgi:hypothetical protein